MKLKKLEDRKNMDNKSKILIIRHKKIMNQVIIIIIILFKKREFLDLINKMLFLPYYLKNTEERKKVRIHLFQIQEVKKVLKNKKKRIKKRNLNIVKEVKVVIQAMSKKINIIAIEK